MQSSQVQTTKDITNQLDDFIVQEKANDAVGTDPTDRQSAQIMDEIDDLRTNRRIKTIGTTMLVNRIG
jgi:low affinity Fe/Cu permease